MATEPHAPPGPEHLGAGSPIENEIPDYRAINPLAVVSVLLALLGILGFADERFAIASVLGVVAGLIGLRRIRNQPETWTGSGLAKAGIALSLAFGVAAFTTNRVQYLIIRQRARQFSKSYLARAINNPDLNYALWYRLPPSARKTTKVEDTPEQFTAPGQGPESVRMGAGQVYDLNQMLVKDKSAKVEFFKVENVGYDGITPTAFVVFKIRHDTGPAEEPAALDHEEDQSHPRPASPASGYVGALLKGETLHRADGWWVQDYFYPYKRDSYVEKPKPVDDGHGHAH